MSLVQPVAVQLLFAFPLPFVSHTPEPFAVPLLSAAQSQPLVPTDVSLLPEIWIKDFNIEYQIPSLVQVYISQELIDIESSFQAYSALSIGHFSIGEFQNFLYPIKNPKKDFIGQSTVRITVKPII